MALPEDPNGYRRGQPGASRDPAGDRRGGDPRQPARPDPRAGGRQPAPRQDDQFASFGVGAPQDRAANGGRQQQPSFSNYRPEAYANEKRDSGRPQEWSAERQFRAETPAAPAPRAAAEAYQAAPAADRPRTQHHDPYSVGGDPYDAGRRDYEAGNDWQSPASFQDQQANQFAAPSFYQERDEPQPDAQSMHDRFFSAEPAPAPVRAPQVAPPPPAPAPQRYQADDYGADDFEPEERPMPRASKPAPSAAPARTFDDRGNDYRWDNFDPQPAPEAVRPFANPKLGADEDLDADYFADEEDFEGDDDYVEPRGGGSKKLMAAVLVGAVVTGGGLAYLYKSQAGQVDSGEPPIMVADPRPIKEQPADPGGRQFSGGSKLIYDRLDGSAGPEEPTRLANNREENDKGSSGIVTTAGGGGTLEERIQNALQNAKKQDDAPATTSANTASTFDTPRPVRTETIRPDGTVDSARPQRRQAPAEADTALASGAPRGAAAREAPPAAAEPQPRRQQQLALATPAPATITTGGEAGMFVQIAARNDQAAAMAAFADLQQKYAGVLGSHSPSVRKVDLGDKGVWFRLLVGPMANKAEADKLCEDLKTAGMKGCFSRKE